MKDNLAEMREAMKQRELEQKSEAPTDLGVEINSVKFATELMINENTESVKSKVPPKQIIITFNTVDKPPTYEFYEDGIGYLGIREIRSVVTNLSKHYRAWRQKQMKESTNARTESGS